MDKTRLIVITGPTASGKTGLALELAGIFAGEVVSADSMQIFKYMEIGTAKPTKDQRARVAHHLIDVVAPDEDYSAARYSSEARAAIKNINSRGKKVFVVGGTGLYIRALTRGIFEGPASVPELREKLLKEAELKGCAHLHERLLKVDPAAASSIHPNNLTRIIRALEVYHVTKRPISELQKAHAFADEPFNCLKIALNKSREVLYSDIEGRVERMMDEGLVDETRRLLSMGYHRDLKPMQGLGYKEMTSYISGECTLSDAVASIKTNTKRYAKRQMTWLNGEADTRWFSPDGNREIIQAVKVHLKGQSGNSKRVVS
jgi:tRNA dimethylallyltransferase